MKIIDQSWEWEMAPKNVLRDIERIGRTCYKSDSEYTIESGEKFVKMLIKSGHLSVIEHVNASVRFITNRGVLAELTRHRLASFSVESTRYCNYSGEMEFIRPVWWETSSVHTQILWEKAMSYAEMYYKDLLDGGWRPEQAREVLPNSLKTEIVVTANMREWLLIFKLRCSPKAHPQMRAIMRSCLEGFHNSIPIIFDDLAKEYLNL